MKQWAVLVGALCGSLALLGPQAELARADVVFDGTLGAPGPAPTRPLDGRTDFMIEQSRGLRIASGGRANLFHSFSTFDLAADQSASFMATDPVDTILARVTGGDPTTIAGLIRSEVPGADLFLINPMGITLTETASLDLPASFIATSADFIELDDGSVFPSTATVPTVTAAAPSAFGFLGGDVAGALVIEGERALTLERGSTFALVGGDVGVRDGSRVFASGGRIDVAAVGSAAVVVPLNVGDWHPRADGTAGLGEVRVDGFEAELHAFDLANPSSNQGQIVVRGGVFVLETSFLRAGGDGPATTAIDIETTTGVEVDNAGVQTFGAGAAGVGGIRVDTDTLSVSQGSVSGIASRNVGTGAAGPIEITAGRVEVRAAGQIQSDADGPGDGAPIVILADVIELDGGAAIQTDTTNAGRSGSVTIVADQIIATDLSEISSRTDGLGFVGNDAGDVSITARTMELRSGARVSGTTDGSGRGADIDLDIEESLLLDGDFVIGGGPVLPSGVFARSGVDAGSPATGDGGDVTIDAGTMTISNGAQIAASPRGEGNAGAITITVDDTFQIFGEGQLQSGVFAQAVEGDGGAITVTADTLLLNDGARIESAALSTGNAGDITLVGETIVLDGDVQVNARSEFEGAAGDVTLRGDTIRVANGARILSLTEADGAAGNINFEQGDVVLESGATVDAESLGTQPAGNVSFNAASVRIGDAARVSTQSVVSQGGNVDVDVSGTFAVDPGGVVITDVRGPTGGGGDVIVRAESVVINDATVTANANAVDAEAGNLFFQVRGGYFESTNATVTANNPQGVDGTVVIDGPVDQVVGDLVSLDGDFSDASDQLETPCVARGSASGSFSVQRERAPPPPPDQHLDPAAPSSGPEFDPGQGRCETAR